MRIKANKVKEVFAQPHLTERELEVEEKLDALIVLLTQNNFDSETIKQYQQRFNKSIEKSTFNPEYIKAFKAIDKEETASREELLDQFSTLLISNKIDSNISSKYIRSERTIKAVLILTGIVMITLGFAMIIMPASHDFEMFTIFWFNPDDGVTLMDLISLIIILAGIYILVRSVYKRSVK